MKRLMGFRLGVLVCYIPNGFNEQGNDGSVWKFCLEVLSVSTRRITLMLGCLEFSFVISFQQWCNGRIPGIPKSWWDRHSHVYNKVMYFLMMPS